MKHAVADPQADRLRSLSPWARCSPAELSLAARLGTFVTVPAGRVLCRQGDLAREAFVVADGEVEVTQHGQIVAHLGPGSLCGEIALLIGGPRVATARTTTRVTVYAMSAAEFRTLLAQAPTVATEVLAQLAARIDRGGGSQLGTPPAPPAGRNPTSQRRERGAA